MPDLSDTRRSVIFFLTSASQLNYDETYHICSVSNFSVELHGITVLYFVIHESY